MVRLASAIVLLLSTATGVGLGFDRPKIILSSPHGTDKFGNAEIQGDGFNMLVKGEVQPAVGKEVTVSIYTVKNDGSLVQVISATTPVRKGDFAISFNPPTKGWTIGQLRVEVVLEDMKQVKASVDLTIAPLDFPPRADKKALKESGVSVDLEKVRGTTIQVPAGTLFYVRGRFQLEGVEDKREGPAIFSEIFIDQPRAKNPRPTFYSGSSLSLREAEDKPLFEYEAQLQAPMSPRIYRVRIASKAAKAGGEFLLEATAPKD
jgi:hypothetical protein